LLQNTTLNLTLTYAVAMTLTLTPDLNSNPLPFRIYIPHSAILHFTVPLRWPHYRSVAWCSCLVSACCRVKRNGENCNPHKQESYPVYVVRFTTVS